MPRRSPRSRRPKDEPPKLPGKARPRATPGSRRKAAAKPAPRASATPKRAAKRAGATARGAGHSRRKAASPVATTRVRRRPARPARGPKRAQRATVATRGGARPAQGRFAPPTPERIHSVLVILDRTYPGAKCALDFTTPLQLLIATILSAQCTDARVNKVTPALFARWPDAAALAGASQEDVEDAVRSTGFFRMKARAIRECCADIVAKHGGEVPRTLDPLTALRGVGRKTANVVLGNAYGIPGVVVDTHVSRVSNRLGFTREQDPVKIEFSLMPLIPEDRWTVFSHWLILHGRAICVARKPRCSICPLAPHCPRIGVTVAA